MRKSNLCHINKDLWIFFLTPPGPTTHGTSICQGKWRNVMEQIQSRHNATYRTILDLLEGLDPLKNDTLTPKPPGAIM